MLGRLTLALSILGSLAVSAAAQERQWSLDIGGDDAYLVFGVPDTDDVGVSFWCTMGSGEIRLFVPAAGEALKPDEKITFPVTVGAEPFALNGRTMANEEEGTTSVESMLTPADPLFAALGKADRFKIALGNGEHIYPLIDADVAGLLRLCQKP